MKRYNVGHLVICLAVLVVQFATPSPARACSCIRPDSPAKAFSDFHAVFIGKVTSVSANYSSMVSMLDRILDALGLPLTYHYTDRFWGYRVSFAVLKSWKNVTTTSVTLRTGSGGGDCGYPFNLGDDYLIYAYEWKDNLSRGLGAGICSRTSELSSASDDLAYLNTKPMLPLNPAFGWAWLCYTGIALLGIAVVFWIALVFVGRRQNQVTNDEKQG